MGYYDIDDIISDGQVSLSVLGVYGYNANSTNQKIPCKFNITAPNLGYLESNPGKPIAAGSKLELPIWLAEVFAIVNVPPENQQFIEMIQPEAFSNKVINAIKTKSTSVDLHSISQHYYALVEKWSAMFTDKELVDVVSKMLRERGDMINNYAQNISGSSSQETSYLYYLDEFEKRIYKTCHESHKSLRKWMHNQS